VKVLQSPSKKWGGSVTIYDPLTMPQVQLIEEVINTSVEDKQNGGRVWLSVIDTAMLPAIVACVKEWNLSDFPDTVTLETFPASPRKASHELVKWLFDEIYKVYIGEIQVPNE
jgi:hypothetical protein